ncbi:MAG: TraR/DksA C4-type zinc finger protein [Geminicoccaceae bacterium]
MASLRDDPAAARDLLMAKRAELAAVLAAPEGEALAEGSLEQQALAQDVERLRRLELQRVEAALQRVEGGEYGWCAACGEPISDARLASDPAVALCIACAEHA